MGDHEYQAPSTYTPQGQITPVQVQHQSPQHHQQVHVQYAAPPGPQGPQAMAVHAAPPGPQGPQAVAVHAAPPGPQGPQATAVPVQHYQETVQVQQPPPQHHQPLLTI